MRLIDADAIPYTMLYKEDFMRGTGVEKRGAWKDDIDAMPTIEPERKKGKWISNGREDCYECSECHAVIEGDEVYWRNNYFCYHCGADMRKEEMSE